MAIVGSWIFKIKKKAYLYHIKTEVNKHVKLAYISLRTCLQNSIVAAEDVKKRNKQAEDVKKPE